MIELLDYNELAKLLRMRKITLKKWVKESKIPYYKLGEAPNAPIRFDLKEIQIWLRDKHRVKARPAYVRRWDRESRAG